ncbi:MAG TPA: DUF4402 domain-containing protein [Thermoanaerobaculia bacterium]
MQSRRIAAAAGCLVALFLIGDLFAADATARATAEVMEPIGISRVSDLRFGSFAARTGGSVVLSPAGGRDAAGSIQLAAHDTGGAAAFEVIGDRDASYAITFPESVAMLHESGATPRLTVLDFTSDPANGGVIDSSGRHLVRVGATVVVAQDQVPGRYAATFSVVVDYD